MDTMHMMSISTTHSSLMDTMALVSSGSEDDADDDDDDELEEDIIQRITQVRSSPPTKTREDETPPQRPYKNKDKSSSISSSQQSKETPKLRQFPYDYSPPQAQQQGEQDSPAYWNARLVRTEVYSRMYRPNRQEMDEIRELEQFLGIPEAHRRRKTIMVQSWRKLNPSVAQASQDNIPMSIVLKRGPVSWASHDDCELILLTRGFVVARKVFQYTPRFQLGDLWSNVDNIRPSGTSSFTIACNDMKTLEFRCPTAADLESWMSALRIVALQAYTHHSSLLDADDEENDRFQPGWQYKLIQTPWFTEAVTGQVQLESNMLDSMDNRDLNVLDTYNQCAPLHYATRANNVDAMRFLLQAGADPNLPDGMGQTPMQRADEDRLPKSTIDLLESYGGKWHNESPRSCGAVAASKDPQRRSCRYRMMAILLLLIVATGLTTFLIWFLGKETAESSNRLESDSSSSTAAQYGAEDEQNGLIPVDEDAAASPSTTPPPFMVVGVNPIPATNLTTDSPFLGTSAEPTANSTAAILKPGYSNDTSQTEVGADFVFTVDTVSAENVTALPLATSALPSYSPSLAPADTLTPMPSSAPTRFTSKTTSQPTLRSSSPTETVVAEVAASAPTISPSLAGKPTEKPKATQTTGTPTRASSSAPTTSKPKGSPTSLPTTGTPTTIGPTAASPSVQVTFDLTIPTEFPTFDGLVVADGLVLLPEDMRLYDFLVEHSLDDGDNLRNPKSPQYQAFRWLSGNMDLPAYSDQRKIQRFALATLYFSTAGDEWSNNRLWLSDTNECKLWFSRIAEVAGDAICNANDEIVTLDLDYNNLSGPLPKEVALLTSLRRIELYGGPQGFLTGSLPTEVGHLSALEALSVKGNRMTGPLPTELGRCTALTNLNLSQNRFSGGIPTELGLLSHLANISLETNRLDGKLPSELGAIAGLVSITLGTNAFTGEIFTEIGLLTALQGLDMEMNSLASEIPTEVGLLTHLSLLHLSVAGIRGTIPSEIGSIESLASLQLRGNALTSTIPASIGRLVKIGKMNRVSRRFCLIIPSVTHLNNANGKHRDARLVIQSALRPHTFGAWKCNFDE
jgi:Leucine-rich repeat (LRR) protein